MIVVLTLNKYVNVIIVSLLHSVNIIVDIIKKNKAQQFLNLDENEEAILFTPLGYGNAEPRDTPRKELDDFVVYKD